MATAVRERRWWILGVGLLTTLLVIVGGSIPTLAVPGIAKGLRSGLGGAELALAAYPLAFAVLPIAGGWVGGLAGRRTVFLAGLTLFSIGMLGAVLASSLQLLILARLLQGLGAALVYGQLLQVLRPSFRGDERQLALSIIGAVGGVGIAAGQLVGGALTTLDPFRLGWRSAFLLLLVLGVGALLGAVVLIPSDPRPAAKPVDPGSGTPRRRWWRGDASPDVGGLVALLLAVALITIPLFLGQDSGWPLWVLLPLLVAPLALVGLSRIEHRRSAGGRAPLLPPMFWNQPGFTIGSVIAILLAGGQAGLTLATVLALELGLGVPPVQVGLICLPMGLATVAAVLLAPWLTRHMGRHLLTLGACLFGAGELAVLLVVHTLGAHLSLWALVPGLIVAGAGQGFSVASLLDSVRASVRPPYRSTASSAIAFCLQVGQAMGLAASGLAIMLASQLAATGGGGVAVRYLSGYQAALAVLALFASVAVALVLVLPRAAEDDLDEEEAEPPRLAGIVGSVLLLTGTQVGDGWLDNSGSNGDPRPGLLKEAPQEPGDFLVRYFRNELADVGWYRSLAEEARALGPGATALESSRDAVMRQQILDIRQHQVRGLVPIELDPAALQLMVVALAAAPHLLPQITRLTTGYDPDTPEFRGIWGRFLRQLGESLTHQPVEQVEPVEPPRP